MRSKKGIERLFPYFFVGTFIEAHRTHWVQEVWQIFPYFFVGTFIEATITDNSTFEMCAISLLFRRDFH